MIIFFDIFCSRNYVERKIVQCKKIKGRLFRKNNASIIVYCFVLQQI